MVFGKVKLESFFSRGNVPAESKKVISHLLGEIMIMTSGPWGRGMRLHTNQVRCPIEQNIFGTCTVP